MPTNNLHEIAAALVAPGKGILAADESFGTIEKRFAKISIASTPESRHAYRSMLFTTPGLSEYISGIILFDETIRDAIPREEMISIIKVDEGLEDFALKPMPGLAGRLGEYKKLGAQAAKARALLTIGNERIEKNATASAEYAKICQDAGIVPIVEPEVLFDGTHDMATCEEVSERYLAGIFEELQKANVDLQGIILKPSMILPGKESSQKASPIEVAEATLRVLKKTVPESVPGVVFLSGGQSEEEATANLNAICKIGGPWRLSFSYGRALQDSALKTWAGKSENTQAAQKVLLERARLNSLASQGKF